MQRRLAVGYVTVVTVLAAVGFASSTAASIVAAVLLALPTAVVAVPVIYLVAGLAAFVPGANPSQSIGAAFVDAALGNVLLLDLVRRRRKGAPAACTGRHQHTAAVAERAGETVDLGRIRARDEE